MFSPEYVDESQYVVYIDKRYPLRSCYSGVDTGTLKVPARKKRRFCSTGENNVAFVDLYKLCTISILFFYLSINNLTSGPVIGAIKNLPRSFFFISLKK